MSIRINSIKLNLLLLVIIVFQNACETSPGFKTLWELYNRREYFKMNSSFGSLQGELTEGESALAGGLLYRVFNKPVESNEKLDMVLNKFITGLNDSVMMEIYQAKMLNYVNLFDYKNAVKMNEILLTGYKHMLDSADLEEYNNASVIWKAGKDLKPQTCVRTGNTMVNLKKDMAGLYNIGLKINGIESEFIFDTGANFSTITASLAKEMKLIPLDGTLKVGTATDLKINAGLAYAESLVIGNISYQYVLFLVLPDEALTFAGGLYKIDGIIGLPVIKEMKEITLTEDNMFVPMISEAKDIKNLSMYSFTPVVNIMHNSDSLIFVFDTGARKTALYKMYYDKYKNYIDSNFDPEELEIEGAGGKKTVKGFILDKVVLNAGGINKKLEDVKLYSENFKEQEKYFFGNIGQDFYSGSARLTINFEYMYFEIKK